MSCRFVSESGKQSLVAAAWLFIAWLLHYVPFWTMGRVLYFHHYFPALIFSSMLTGKPHNLNATLLFNGQIVGVILDYLLQEIPRLLPARAGPAVYHTVLALVVSSVLYSFAKFSPLAYGMSGPGSGESNSTMHGLKWLDSWEF